MGRTRRRATAGSAAPPGSPSTRTAIYTSPTGETSESRCWALRGSFRAALYGESGLSKWAKEWFAANRDEYNARLTADMEPPMDRLSSGSARDRSASTEKLFWGPTSVRVDAQGRVYVVDSMRHRIQIYQKVADRVDA